MITINTGMMRCDECGKRFASTHDGGCPFCGKQAVRLLADVDQALYAEYVKAREDLHAHRVPYEMTGRPELRGDVAMVKNARARWVAAHKALWSTAVIHG